MQTSIEFGNIAKNYASSKIIFVPPQLWVAGPIIVSFNIYYQGNPSNLRCGHVAIFDRSTRTVSTKKNVTLSHILRHLLDSFSRNFPFMLKINY
jgi:hypothetical protein